MDSTTETSFVPTADRPVPVSSQRAFGLDALRGLAILLMVLSAHLSWGVFPSWMYHAQVPPPDHRFDPGIPGITWVDLVFPLFLFCMGAAFPVALGRRLAAGRAHGRIVLDILHRGFLLGFFAIFHQHMMPHVLDPDRGTPALLTSMAGFGLMFAVFCRFPDSWKWWVPWAVRAGGWLSVVVLLANVEYPDGSGFSLYRSNIILVVLTNMAVFGALIYLVVQRHATVYLGILLAFIAIRLSAGEEGVVQALYRNSPVPWIFHMRYLQYLHVVIPGILAGRLLWDWMRAGEAARETGGGWSERRWAVLAAFLLMFSAAVLIGLQERWLWQTNLLAAAGIGAGAWITKAPGGVSETFIRSVFLWGAAWLVIGLLFEPYEGGIKKDSATISYYYVCAALSSFLLASFIVVIDRLKKKHWVRLLVDNGQNPMIAYVGGGLFVIPVLTLLGVHGWLMEWAREPWPVFFRALGYTLLVALMVRFFTRRKIFWRT